MSEPVNPAEELKIDTPETSAPVEDVKEAEVASESKAEDKKVEVKDDVQYGDEDDEEKQVKLENKADLVTGTEEEEPIWINNAKLYRFRDGKWKERGNGNCKLLRHKTKNRVRFLLRTEKTKKLTANFYVAQSPLCELKPKTGNDKSYLWVAKDFSEGEVLDEKFAILFKNKEEAEIFEKAFNDAKEFNKQVEEGATDLVFAPAVEDVKEEVEQDDENKPAEEHK